VKLIGVVLLCITSIAVLLGMVVPAAALALGLGIEIPSAWARSGKVLLVYSHPWISLVVGTTLLVVFGWGVWKLTRG